MSIPHFEHTAQPASLVVPQLLQSKNNSSGICLTALIKDTTSEMLLNFK